LGVDPERHWDQIARHLKYHDYVCDFDVKAWEEKVDQRLLHMTTNVKLAILKESMENDGIKWDPRTDKIAHGLVVDYIHADVAFENFVYEKRSGLLSGHPGTFMENTEIHEMILGLACKRILDLHAPSLASIPFIMENVRSIKAADDIVIAISPLARKIITVERLVAEYNEIGYELTAPDKSATICAKSIAEAQFLKHSFAGQNEVFTAQPNESIIHQLLNWVRTNSAKPNDRTAVQFLENIGNAIRFGFWRGREYYESLVDKINKAVGKTNVAFRWDYSYDEMIPIIKRTLEVSREDALALPITDITQREDMENSEGLQFFTSI